MSAIAGLVRFDGAPIDPGTIARMAARLRLRGFEVAGAATSGASLLIGTRGPDFLPQPVRDRDAIAVLDGRIDNRDELIGQLQLPRDAGDAAIAVAAYRKWGDTFAAHLLGDFAIAIADTRQRRLIGARDVFGNRRFHYRAGAGWIAFASSIDCLVAAIAPMPAINEGMAGEMLASFVVSADETLYEGVSRLPAAHALLAQAGSIRTLNYWEPSPTRLRYTRDGEYEEHLRSLLTNAVRACLRTSSPAAIMLSGGLDSSSVAMTAAPLINARSVTAPALETFSVVGRGDADESPFTDAVASQAGLTAHHIPHQLPRPGQFAEEIALDLEPQLFPHSPTLDVLRRRVRDRGARVVLTGIGGDDWLGTAPAALADLLRRGRVWALLRRLSLDRGADHDPGWQVNARAAVWPLLPAPMQAALRRVFRRGQAPAWIAPEFAKRIGLIDRMAAYRPMRRFTTHEQDANWFEAMNGWRMFVTENVTRGADRFGLDLAHPFFDRRLVEFCLALPPEQLWRDGRPKDLLRRAMRGIVPAAVSERRASPAGDDAFLDVLAVESGTPPFTGLDVERRGWIDGNVIRAMHGALPGCAPQQQASHARILWGIRSIDLWLDARNMVKLSTVQQGAESA